MKTSVASFFLGFVVAVWLTPVARRIALRSRLVDRPQDGRRVNQKTIPRAGGLAIAAGILAPILGLAIYENEVSHAIYENMTAVVMLLIGALAALGVGLADDLARPSAKLRLLALIAIAAATWFGGHRIDAVVLPWLGPITLGDWSLPATVLWIVGIIVAFNFVDGLDGLASGIALISTATLFVYALIDQNVLWMTWTGAMAGALLGFLMFNFNPASIFMGDAGSNFLGYLLAVVALQTSRKEATAVSLLVPLCVLGLPILDVTLTMVRRALLQQGLFTSERGHLHHRLLQLGLSHRRAVLVLYAVSAVLCLGAVSVAVPVLHLHLAIAALITVVVFSLMFATGYIHPRDLLQMYHQGKANRARQRQIEDACHELARHAANSLGAGPELARILHELVGRGCVTAVRYRCEHQCELVAGAYHQTAKGTRHSLPSGPAGGADALVYWKDRTDDASPREIAALGKLFAGLQCSCACAPVDAVGALSCAEAAPPAAFQLERIWSALVEAAEKLSVLRVELELNMPWNAHGFRASWERPTPGMTDKSWRLDLPVMAHERVVGTLHVTGHASREDIASLLEVLDASESYLASVYQEQARGALVLPGPFSDRVRGHAVQTAARVSDA